MTNTFMNTILNLSKSLHISLSYMRARWNLPKWTVRSYERLNTQMDNSQTIYENRTVTHSLCSHWPRKPDHELGSDQPISQLGQGRPASQCACASAQGQTRKARCAAQISPTPSEPTSSFPINTTSRQSIPEGFFSHSVILPRSPVCLWGSAQCNWWWLTPLL